MSHCQICLSPIPHHANNCPVKTGQPVMGSISDQAIGQQPGSLGQMRHDPAAIELRIERLETELAQLKAQFRLHQGS